MHVAKLSTGQLVRLLKPAQLVSFAEGEHILISQYIGYNPNRIRPEWVLSTYLVWSINFGESNE